MDFLIILCGPEWAPVIHDNALMHACIFWGKDIIQALLGLGIPKTDDNVCYQTPLEMWAKRTYQSIGKNGEQ